MKKLVAFSLTIALAACKIGPDYELPDFSVTELWSSEENVQSFTTGTINEKWWQVFNDPLLDNLINQAMEHNHDLRMSITNLDKAKAMRREAQGSLWPSLTANETAEKQGLSKKTTANSNSGGARERDQFSGTLDASWELDIFGGLRREVEAREAELQAAEEAKRGVTLSILAEVALNYFEVLGLQKRITVLKHNIELVREVEDLARAQFEGGIVTEADVVRARGERESIEANLPTLQANMMAGVYRLSVLTGKSPEAQMEKFNSHSLLPTPPDLVPVGMRSDILRRRPDIREAERNLAMHTAEVGVAVSELYPSISITGDLGSSAALFSDLFTQGALRYTLGNTINMSLFKGGATRARIAQAEADAEVALLNYEKTILVALEDAENSLTRYGKEWQRLKSLLAAEASRKEAFNIARLRYEAGEGDFINLLDAERSLVIAQDDVIQSETVVLTNYSQLYKALGGGWEVFEIEPEQTKP